MSKAAGELIARAKVIAARLLNASSDQIEFADGRFGARSTNRSFNLLELARELARSTLPDELKRSLRVTADNEMHEPVFPNGCAVCECEVDPESGGVELTRYAAVDDVGRCINPMIVHGQTHGGIAQGVGQALWEQCYLDPDSGQPFCGSLMDYGMPRSDTLPSFTTEIVEVLSPTNPLGIKAGGEGGTTPAPAAVISAIVNALSGFGICDITMPATPLVVWQAIQRASGAGGGQSDDGRRGRN
jgi:carbon-monoxide dehydrogenase large subunit